MPQIFTANAHYTLGVEIELQLVNAETGALSNSIQQILDRVPPKWVDAIKPEFMQSYCEINTGICNTVKDVENDLTEKLQWATEVAEELGLNFIWGGTHPFSRWEHQKVTPGERYAWLLDAMQDVARRLLIFGLHVHVGVDSGDKAIHLCDRLLRHIPTLLALSANSPYWCGRDSGMQSYRSKIIEALPTAGLPQTMRNWSEYVWLIDHLIKTKFISSIREIWWDVRPHAGFGTVEMRVMDMPMNMKRYRFTDKATEELKSDNLDLTDALESILNAKDIEKKLRSKSPFRQRAEERLYIIKSRNYSGTLLYTKGKIGQEAGQEVFYIFISAKRSTVE